VEDQEIEQSVEDTDARLRQWWQGDFSRDHQTFILAQNSEPSETAEVGFEDAEDGIQGMVVLTQTCDIVRSAAQRPYVEVCPLVELSEKMYPHVRRGTNSRFAIVPSSTDKHLAADLDRVMTVRKEVVARWNREQGCVSDGDRIRFAQSLERKRGRFAFPNDFSVGMEKFNKHILNKHGKLSSEAGQAYLELDEIRVRATPNWHAAEIELTFYFVISPEKDRTKLDPHIDELFQKIDLPEKYKFPERPYDIASLDDLSARQYRESVSLDFEMLSLG